MSFYIHSYSKLSASAIVNHIKKTKKVPADYKKGFSVKGKTILATSSISLPLPKGAKRGLTVKLARWYELICFASMKPDKTNPNNDWYITTGVVVGEKRHIGKRYGSISESTSITIDISPGQLIKLQKSTPQKPAPRKTVKPKSVQHIKIDKPGKISPRTTPKLPAKIQKSLAKVSPLISRTFAGQDALGLCLPNNKWPEVTQAGAGYKGNGGLLIVANRVDFSTFKSRRAAALSKTVVEKNIGETLIHEMIHAGRYASGMNNWIGHSSKDFGPFL